MVVEVAIGAGLDSVILDQFENLINLGSDQVEFGS